jgi:hypothetical protein
MATGSPSLARAGSDSKIMRKIQHIELATKIKVRLETFGLFMGIA